MIHSKTELLFFQKADLMMNRGYFKRTPLMKIKELISPDYVIRYLKVYRQCQYYSRCKDAWSKLCFFYYNTLKNRKGAALGLFIGGDYGYGLVVPHNGSVVAGGIVGNYAVLHSSICITGNVRTIGDCLYVSTGAKIVGEVDLGNNITIAPNAVVTKNRRGNNLFLDGSPAEIKKDSYPIWYVRDGFEDRVKKVEELKQKMGLA